MSDDHTVVVWNVATGQTQHTLQGHASRVTGVAFSPDGRTLAYGFNDGTVFLTQVPDGTVLHQLTATAGAPSDLPTALAFSPDGNTLATAGSSGKVRLWDPHTGAAAALGGPQGAERC